MDQLLFEANTAADGYSSSPNDADQFVPVPQTNGLLDYAVIPDELTRIAGMLPVPVRLTNGRNFFGSGGGYGIAHMLYKHSAAMANLGFFSVQDFVDHVAQGFDAIYLGERDRRIVVRRKDEQFHLVRLLVLELARTRDYYSVVSGWTVSARRPIRGDLVAELVQKEGVKVWECRAPHSKGPGVVQSNAPAD